MVSFSEVISALQSFFQLNFLFSGLEVSSSLLFTARVIVFLVCGAGVIWAIFQVVMKVLDCLQTVLSGLGSLPKIVYFLLFLVIPLSPNSVGATWIGYIFILSALIGFALLAILALALWKYGVEQTLRLIDRLRSRRDSGKSPAVDSLTPQDDVLRPVPEAPPVRTET